MVTIIWSCLNEHRHLLTYRLTIASLRKECAQFLKGGVGLRGERGDLVQQREIGAAQLGFGLANQLAPSVAAQHLAFIEIGKVMQERIADRRHAPVYIAIAKVLWIEFAGPAALPNLASQR
jgi:hypothetical protein